MILGRLVVDFQVSGIPQPKGSMKNVAPRWRRAVLVSANPKLLDWHLKGTAAAAEAMKRLGEDLVQDPVMVEAVYSFPRPLSHLKKQLVLDDSSYALVPKIENSEFFLAHIVQPDCDKLLRATCDLLTGTVLRDDSLATRCFGVKRYAEGPGFVGSRIRVWIEDPKSAVPFSFRPTVRMSRKIAALRVRSDARTRK